MQTLGAIRESINETRHYTAASYTIRWDTGPRGVYLSTEPVSRRLAASAGTPDCTFSPLRWEASGKGKMKEASGGRGIIIRGGGKTEGGARPMVCTRMLTPLIDGLGHTTWSSTMPVTRSRTPSFWQNRHFYFSSACCTKAVGIAHQPLRYL